MRSRTAVGAVASLLVALVLGACSGYTVGSGTARTEQRSVSGFSAVELGGSGEVRVEQGTSESLTIEADDNILPLLTSEVSGDTLVLGAKSGAAYSTRTPVTYRVTVTDLTGLRVSGSGEITATGIDGTALEIAITGSGTITVDGTADRLTVDISGSGGYSGGSFTTRAADVTISGSGDAVVDATATLRATISGSGSVTYLGDPAVTEDVSGSGEVRKQ